MKVIISLLLLLEFDSLVAQHSSYNMKYDDSTLNQKSAVTLMPFNRLVKSAGKVITYGDPSLENHALDFSILPDKKHIAIEDRYGVAILDVKKQKITHQWRFENDQRYRGLMSTYSGIKSFNYNSHMYIAWSASGRNNHRSAVMVAEWNDTGFTNVVDIPISPLAPATAALPNDIAIQFEKSALFLYVVLNGNNQLLKIRFTDKQIVWSANSGSCTFWSVCDQ